MTPRLSTARRYAAVIRWFVADGLVGHRWLVVGIVAGSMLSLLFQVQAIGLVAVYSQRLAQDETIELLGRSIAVRDTPWTLPVAGGLVLVSLVLAAGLRYLSRRSTLALRRDYALRCWERALHLLEAPGFRPGRTDVALDIPTAIQRVRTDSMLCSRFIALLVLALVSLANLTLTVAALVIVNVWLTIVIGMLAAVSGVVLYRINVQAARYSLEYEEAGPPAGRETSEAIRRIAFTPPGAGASEPTRIPAGRAFVASYVARLRSADDSELVGNVFFALILTTVLVGLGVQTFMLDRGTAVAAIYLVGLPYALIAFRNLMRTATLLNRFYPMARRYVEFVEDVSDDEGPEGAGAGAGDRRMLVPACDPPAEGSDARPLEPRAGDTLLIVTDLEPTRFSLPFLLGTIFVDEDHVGIVPPVQVVSGRIPPVNVEALRAIVDGPQGPAVESLVAETGRKGGLEELEAGGSGRAELAVLVRVVAAAAAAGPGGVVVLDERSLAAFGAEDRAVILGRLEAQVRVIVGGPGSDPTTWPGIGRIAVVGRRGRIAMLPPSRWPESGPSLTRRLDDEGRTPIFDADDELM